MYRNNTIHTLGMISILLWLTSVAGAEIVPVAPFTGDLNETWESFPTPTGEEDYLADPSLIMEGAASIANPHMFVYEPGIWDWSLGSSGYAGLSDGAKGMGLGGWAQTATIVFTEPVLSFGAYWGAWTDSDHGNPALITVSFFNESDDLMAVEILEYSRPFDGLLEWHGWASTIPIKSITYVEDKVAIDGLQAHRVPEPTTLASLLFGGLLLRRSKRRSSRTPESFRSRIMNARNTIQIVFVLSNLAWVTSTARAEIIPVDPFTGVLTETWESFPTTPPEGPYLPDPTVIMTGAASISNQLMAVYEPGVREFGLGSSGNAAVSDGRKGMGIERLAETAVLAFENPVLRFGAYWGAWTNTQVGGDPALISVSFFNEHGGFIATEAFEYSRSFIGDGALEWHGWSSTVGIQTITYTEDKVVIDGLQADPVPEPASILFLMFGCLLLPRCKQYR